MFLLHKNAPRGCDQMHEEHVRFVPHNLYMKTAGKYMKKKLNKYNKCISYCFYMKNILNNKIIEKKSRF